VTADGNAVANQVALYSGACALTENASFVDVGGKVGIGTSSPGSPLTVAGTSSPLQVVGTFTSLSTQYGVNVLSNWTPTNSDSNDAVFGMLSQAAMGNNNSSTNGLGLRGVEGYSYNSGSGNVTGAAGLVGLVQNSGGGTITNAYGAYVWPPGASTTSPITNSYGAYISVQKVTGVANGYGIYAAGGNDINYFAGNVGIGTATPGTNKLEVNGAAKFDSAVTFAGTLTGSGSGLTSLTPTNISAGTAGISINGNAATATTATNATSLAGVAGSNYARLDIGNTLNGNQAVTGNVSASGNLFVGTGNPAGYPLEISEGGQNGALNDALTVDSQGNVTVGAGTGAHITTGSANSDFAGGNDYPNGGGSVISIASGQTAANPPVTFAVAFTYVPTCVVTPYVVPGAAAPTAGIPSWYITYGTNSQGYNSFTVNLVSQNPNSNPITFSYVCVGNPN